MTELRRIGEKVRKGERLTLEEGVSLFRTNDLHALGRLADEVRERKNGRRAYYVRNLHLNYTNVCAHDCCFCSFSRKKGEEGAWEMDLEAIFAHAARAEFDRLTEVHIVGGVHPGRPFEFYRDMLRGLKDRYPDLHLKAFTATEIDHIARVAGREIDAVLRELKDAGLGSLPGGGAEVFSERVWKELGLSKTRPDRWLDIHRTAHKLGLRSTSTMLYGHVETDEERVAHLLRLRELQDETGGFTAFVPLAYHPENNRLGRGRGTTAQTDIKVHAAARLLLDNFDHIKAYWVMTGLPMAQLLLSYGVDDIDGTVVEERIVHMAGAESPPGVSEGTLRALIREAGREPVLRDTLYNPIEPQPAT